MNVYFGAVSDGRGSPVAGVSITAGDATGVTDATGRYEFRSARTSLVVTAVIPPNGYEGRYSGDGTLTPGEHNFIVRRISRIEIHPSRNPVPVSDGTNWYGVSPTVEFGTGEVELLSGTREQNVRLTSSDPTVLRTRTDGGRPVIEGVSPGAATVTATYWSVTSSPVTVQVVPR